jgi:hypothetical protein
VNERDRLFLREYAMYAGRNHTVAAVALFQAGRDAEGTAGIVEGLVRHQGSSDAKDTARRLNTAAAVQTVVVGRLMAELVATIEDVAALGWAIRERNHGLLERYLKSSVGEAVEFLDLTLLDPPADLTTMLRLPTVSTLESRLGIEPPQLVGEQCVALETSLRELGRAYRDVGSPVAPAENGGEPDDQIHVLLAIGEPEGGRKKVRGLLPEALNKLKHRFVLVAAISELGRLPGAPVRYAHIGRDPRTVDALFKRIVYVESVGVQLAELLRRIADAGLDDPVHFSGPAG